MGFDVFLSEGEVKLCHKVGNEMQLACVMVDFGQCIVTTLKGRLLYIHV